MKKKTFDEGIDNILEQGKSEPVSQQYIKRAIDIPISFLEDIKILKVIKKQTQRDLIATILAEYIEKHRDQIDSIKNIIK